MWDRVVDYFLEAPERLGGLGRALASAGSFIIVAGVIGHVARSVNTIALSIGKPAAGAKSLAELYPSLWTWWVPESIIGAMPALILIGFGVWLVLLERRLQRLMA